MKLLLVMLAVGVSGCGQKIEKINVTSGPWQGTITDRVWLMLDGTSNVQETYYVEKSTTNPKFKSGTAPVPYTIKWTGYRFIKKVYQTNEGHYQSCKLYLLGPDKTLSGDMIDRYEIGMRDDGVLVWRPK